MLLENRHHQSKVIMEEYAPRILNGMTPAEARAALMKQVHKLRYELGEMQALSVEISPHMAWVINKKLITIERGIDGVETGVRLYFEEGEMYA
jgi:hypothetical protein